MKEIKLNEINMKNINNIIKKYEIILLDKDNNVYLNNNHNTLEFIKTDILEKALNKLVIVKKEIDDFPLFNDNTLYITEYLIDTNVNNYNINNMIKVYYKDLIKVLNDNMYDNPRNNEYTKQIIKVSEELAQYIDKC